VEQGEQATFESLLTGTLARASLLWAAYLAEHQAFTRANILGSLLRCTRWPFDPIAMPRQCRGATGLVVRRGILHEEASAAAIEVIKASTERNEVAAASLSEGKPTVRRDIFHSPADLLPQHAENVAAEAARVADEVKRKPRGKLRVRKRLLRWCARPQRRIRPPARRVQTRRDVRGGGGLAAVAGLVGCALCAKRKMWRILSLGDTLVCALRKLQAPTCRLSMCALTASQM